MPGKLGEGTSSVSELLFRLDNPDRLHSSRLEEGMGGLCLLGFDEPDQEKEWRLFFFLIITLEKQVRKRGFQSLLQLKTVKADVNLK